MNMKGLLKTIVIGILIIAQQPSFGHGPDGHHPTTKKPDIKVPVNTIDKKQPKDKIIFLAKTGNTVLIKANLKSDAWPECASSSRFAIAKDSPLGAAVEKGFREQKTIVSLKGSGQCKLWNNAQDLLSIQFK